MENIWWVTSQIISKRDSYELNRRVYFKNFDTEGPLDVIF